MTLDGAMKDLEARRRFFGKRTSGYRGALYAETVITMFLINAWAIAGIDWDWRVL